jgi:DNA-directed RNA polymerase specialized sigma24 family protein
MLRSRRTRREASLETHLPDPILSAEDGIDPEQEAVLGDSIGLALLVVLDTLTPAERISFVLHDVFAAVLYKDWAQRKAGPLLVLSCARPSHRPSPVQ